MRIERVFRIAPSLVRVILRERLVSTNIVEGYLPSTREKTQFVRLESVGCHLLLQSSSDQGRAEERTKIPIAQAEALLDISEGRIGYRRSQLRIGNDAHAFLDRYEQPSGLDLVVLQFGDEHKAEAFEVLPWFGPEVTNQDSFRRRTLATSGAPPVEHVDVSNRALIALLDTLEHNNDSRQQPSPSADLNLAAAAPRKHEIDPLPRRVRLPVRLPEEVRFPPSNEDLVGQPVLDHRLPDAFEVGATKSDPSGDTPNNEPDVEIKRSAKRLTSFLGRMKPAR